MGKTEQAIALPEVQAKPARKGRAERGSGWLYIPALVYMIVVTQAPFVLSLWFSLHAWNLIQPSLGFPFVGLSNYGTIFFQDPNFWPILGHTLELVVGAMVLALIGGTVVALLLNRPMRGRNILRGLATIPFLVTPSVMALVWKNLFLSPSFGIVDWALRLVGLPAIPWFSSNPLLSVTLITAWQWIPFVMLVVLAGLQAIPDEVFEAARVDGATSFTTFWRIVLPLLRRAYEIAIVFGTILIFQTFGKIYLTTGGGPGIATNTLPYYTYRVAFTDWQMGLASAIGVIGVILAILCARGMLRLTGQGGA
jgi:sorbitol/mannitol transport system permease protein